MPAYFVNIKLKCQLNDSNLDEANNLIQQVVKAAKAIADNVILGVTDISEMDKETQVIVFPDDKK